jgi:CheY-like chemotaxis protein
VASRHHELTLSMPPTPMRVRADAARLAQVIANLLHNAAKYTASGGEIRVSVSAESGSVVLSVRDNGVGIPPEMLARVFDPFTQAAPAPDGGLGIGLTLVKQLVELHGGHVEAHSAGIGHGSEFIVRLPAIESSDAADRMSAVEAAMPPPDHRPVPSESLRVLVVDDNVDAVEALTRILTGWGHVLESACDGVAAVRTAAVFEPDVVLLDLGLPRMDGLTVARRLRESRSGRSLLLVAMTGFGQHADRRRSAEAGFDHHLVKPVDLDTLRGILAADTAPSGPRETAAERDVHARAT